MTINSISDSELKLEYQRRFSKQAGDALYKSEDALLHFRGHFQHSDREQMICVFLNGQNKIISTEVLFTGTLTASAIYPREIVKRIIHNEASAIILAHNHPSGNTRASSDDIKITKRIKDLCELIGTRLLDHLIITAENYHSMGDDGLV